MQDFASRTPNGASLVRRLRVRFPTRPFACYLLGVPCLLLAAYHPGSQSTAPRPAQQPAASTPQAAEDSEAPLPGDWAPELLDGILSSSNPQAQEALYHAAFGAGPAIIPQLEAALQDDRTAEFAAQSLAFIGGEKALVILSKLVNDPRDLDLRRFYYGALGEFESPQATQVLLNAIERADDEEDRTVTEAAIIALTVRSDPKLVSTLRQSEAKIKDVVIRDDIDNALDVIEARARYLATPQGQNAGGSIEEAVRTYFIPALESQPSASSKMPLSKPAPGAVGSSSNPSQQGRGSRSNPSAKPSMSTETGVKVSVQNLTLAPDKGRALARVIFEDPSASADYDIVLQKRVGNWTIASVWLGTESEKAPPQKTSPPAREKPSKK